MPYLNLTPDESMKALQPDINPTQAKARLPVDEAAYVERVREHDKANENVTQRDATSKNNLAVRQFIRDLRDRKASELSALNKDLRVELYSLQGDFALVDQTARVRALTDAVWYLDTELEFLTAVKEPADDILHQEAVANERMAACNEALAAARLSFVRAVIASEALFAEEGQAPGIVSPRTIALQREAEVLRKQAESAQAAMRSARALYDQRMAARASRGIITSGNVHNAIGRAA